MRCCPTGAGRVAAIWIATCAPAADASSMRNGPTTGRALPAADDRPASASSFAEILLGRAVASPSLGGRGMRDPLASALTDPTRRATARPELPPVEGPSFGLPAGAALGREAPILADVEAPRRRELVQDRPDDRGLRLPEPGSFLLVATGAAGLLLRRRMRRGYNRKEAGETKAE